MAGYSRYRRTWRSGSARTNRSYIRRWYGGKNKRYWGQFKAANQQRDISTVVLNSIQDCTLAYSTTAAETVQLNVFNLWNVLRQSDFFDNYSGMYDQVKLDSARIKLIGTWMEQSSGDQGKRMIPTIVTAFDRNGFLDGTTPDADAVASYSSAIAKPWSLGSAFSQTRSLYTSTMQEKSQYIPTSSLKNPATANTCANPCWNGSCISCPFKPIYIVRGSLPSAPTERNTVLHLQVEFDLCVTFRGLRKRASAYEGMDIYSLQAISYDSTAQDVDDAYVVPEGGSVEFTEPGMVVSYFENNIGLYFAARYVDQAKTLNLDSWSGQGPKGYVFIPSDNPNGSVELVFRENEGGNIVNYGTSGQITSTAFTIIRLPGPVFTMDPAWYTADEATRGENMEDLRE